MIGPLNKKPGGTSPQAKFLQGVWDNQISGRPQSASGARINRTTRGFVVVPSEGGGTSVSVRMLKLRLVRDDYLICRSWDAESETVGGSDILVAKQYKHRNSIEAEEVYGTTNEYTYADDEDEPFVEFEEDNPWGDEAADFEEGGAMFEVRLNVIRTVDDGTDTEEQRIVPPWLRGDIIYAISARTGVSVPATELDPEADPEDPAVTVTFLHVGEARQWARILE
jgi:hypothetical protein